MLVSLSLVFFAIITIAIIELKSKSKKPTLEQPKDNPFELTEIQEPLLEEKVVEKVKKTTPKKKPVAKQSAPKKPAKKNK